MCLRSKTAEYLENDSQTRGSRQGGDRSKCSVHMLSRALRGTIGIERTLASRRPRGETRLLKAKRKEKITDWNGEKSASRQNNNPKRKLEGAAEKMRNEQRVAFKN